jgi:hypothetical protein
MLWHLTVDFGTGSPLHFLAPYDAAVTFAREAVEGGWVRSDCWPFRSHANSEPYPLR